MTQTSIRLRNGSQALRDALENLPQRNEFPLLIGESSNAVVIIDPLDRIIYINPGFTRMLGHNPADILGRHVSTIFGNRDGETLADYRVRIDAGESFSSEEIVFGLTGQRLWASVTANPVHGADGHVVTVLVLTDITVTKLREVLHSRAVDAMARDVSSAEVLELICRDVETIIPEAVVAVNGLDEHNRLYPIACPSLPDNCRRAIRGGMRTNDPSPSWLAAISGQSVAVEDLTATRECRERMRDFLEFGIQACWATPITGPDGRTLGTVTYYYFEKRLPDDFQKSLSQVLVNLCGLALERTKIREDMRQLSFYDPLTRLPNRSLLLANGDKMLGEFREKNREVPTAIFCVNLDRFRQVNASFGYDAGNELLVIIAQRLAEKRYPGDSVGRIGADEFALVLPGCDEAKASLLANRILQAIASPCAVAGEQITPTASIGIALYPDNGYGMEALLDFANTAMALAKSCGDNQFKFYNEDANVRARRRLSLESRLRSATSNNEFRLFYQPQVLFDTGKLYGVEALARWDNDEYGSIPPENFIPLAEAAGLIDGISDWVVTEVCRQMGEWRKHGVAVPSIAVNLSAPNFRDPSFPLRIKEQIDYNGLTVNDLVLELTESIFLDSDPQTLQTIRKAKEIGFRLSLDDFGTGYSGLGYLRNIPITEIKLDRSFVRDLASDPTSRALSQAIMRLGENLGLRVIVEGVETAEQFYLLKNQGFHILQGYYVSHPLSPEALAKWIAEEI